MLNFRGILRLFVSIAVCAPLTMMAFRKQVLVSAYSSYQASSSTTSAPLSSSSFSFIKRRGARPFGPRKKTRETRRQYQNDSSGFQDLVAAPPPPPLPSTPTTTRKRVALLRKRAETRVVRTVNELRSAVLDEQKSLSETTIRNQDLDATTEKVKDATEAACVPTDFFDQHAVQQLMKERYQTRSTPGHRLENDNSTLALSIEGGGMRGCVSAGMVSAIAALGLTDTVDTIYGSSAGSVVGAYLVSRQVCMDVYVDILPAAKKLFVCKTRLIKSLVSSLVDVVVNTVRKDARESRNSVRRNPGMNISFVLDSVMGQDHGIRPLDLETFRKNDAKQSLRVVSSCLDPKTGKLFSKCFGTQDFFHEKTAVEKVDKSRQGLFACLEASMTVPGATGPPVNFLQKDGSVLHCFDAFCFEPIPYRSAVEEGATHVLVLSSRPQDYTPKTKPGIYETGIAPLYFHSHGHGGVSEFFEHGGQQYLYAEDLLTFEEANRKKVLSKEDETDQRVMIPPPELLYGVPRSQHTESLIENRESEWKRAHLMAIRVPKGHKELSTLEQDKEAVLEAVRGGFAAAFDSLSSIVGMDHIKGAEAAKLVFPADDDTTAEQILSSIIQVPGEGIPGPMAESKPKSLPRRLAQRSGRIRERSIFRRFSEIRRIPRRRGGHENPEDLARNVGGASSGALSHQTLLATLPGFASGRFQYLAQGLYKGSA